MNAREWLAAYAEKLGVDPPTTEEFKVLLDLAGGGRALLRAGCGSGRVLGRGEGRR